MSDDNNIPDVIVLSTVDFHEILQALINLPRGGLMLIHHATLTDDQIGQIPPEHLVILGAVTAEPSGRVVMRLIGLAWLADETVAMEKFNQHVYDLGVADARENSVVTDLTDKYLPPDKPKLH